jgi:biopolymer transport protein TolR
MGMSSSGDQGPMADINVTPLVDVMLVLLIIFMITAPMMNNAGVEIDLPQSDAPPLEQNPDEPQLVLSIDRTLAYYIDDQTWPVDELLPKLTAIASANPEQDVFLRADGEVPYAEVARYLGLAKKAGMPKVGLVFEPGVDVEAGTDER